MTIIVKIFNEIEFLLDLSARELSFNRYLYFLYFSFLLDTNIRNIIEKLAEFVARNGPEFEAITKQKQTTNPKFQFLYGGEYAEYYRYRVSMEQLLSCK